MALALPVHGTCGSSCSAATGGADPASRIGPGDLWLVIYSVLPDRTAQFEAVARQVREALARSPQDIRKAQARDLRIHRSALPNADGKVMYFLQIPALTGDADRSGFDVLIDAVLPEQASALKKAVAGVARSHQPVGQHLPHQPQVGCRAQALQARRLEHLTFSSGS